MIHQKLESTSSFTVKTSGPKAAVAGATDVEKKRKREKKRRRKQKKSDGDRKAKSTEQKMAKAPTESSPSKKLLVLISSCCPNMKQKTNQERALTIIKGLKIGGNQMETVDGAVDGNREKRNKLFRLSGRRSQLLYPQFFLVDGDSTTFLADWDDFEAMNEMGTLKESIDLS
jgi:hypothetical protein